MSRWLYLAVAFGLSGALLTMFLGALGVVIVLSLTWIIDVIQRAW